MLIFENVHGLILWAVCDGGICSSMFTVTQTNVSAGKRKCCEVLESVSALCVCRKGSKPIGRMICKFVFLCVDFIMYVSHLLLVHSYSSIYQIYMHPLYVYFYLLYYMKNSTKPTTFFYKYVCVLHVRGEELSCLRRYVYFLVSCLMSFLLLDHRLHLLFYGAVWHFHR